MSSMTLESQSLPREVPASLHDGIQDNAPEADVFASLATELRVPLDLIETTFLDVGGRLGQCMTILSKIACNFEALPRDFDSEEMREASTCLEAVASEARRMATAFKCESTGMLKLSGAVSAAARPIKQLQRLVRTIEAVAVNARVVAAGIADVMEGSEVFTVDITALSKSASETLDEFSRIYEQLARDIVRADEQRTLFEQFHGTTLSDLASRIDDQFVKVTERRQAASTSSAETGRLSRQITARISAAVSALQVGDNMRQRVEHVEAALNFLSDLATGREHAGIRPDLIGDQAPTQVIIDAVCGLQSAQLGAALDSFQQEASVAEHALRELAHDTSTAVRQSVVLYSGEDETAPLHALNAELQRATALLKNYEGERKTLDQMADIVSQRIGELLGLVESVQAIERNMRLLSFNANVTCAHLGSRGAGLSVIAGQLRDLTADTVMAAEETVASLDEVSIEVRSIAAAAGTDTGNGTGRLGEQASRAIALLRRVDDRLSAALVDLEQGGTRACRLLDEAVFAFSHQAEIASEIHFVNSRISAARVDASLLSERDGLSADALAGVFAFLRSRYTMEAERHLHDTFAAEAGN